jgi:hypothetical protein
MTTHPFAAPVVDALSVRVLVDSRYERFLPRMDHPHVKIEHVGRIVGRPESTFACEWGLSLHLTSEKDGAKAQYVLDFGYTPEIINRNFELLGIEPGKPFAPDARQARILGQAAQLGDLMARTSAYAKRDANAVVYPGKRWEYAVRFDLDQENPERTRVQFDERGEWFYEAIGMSTGMQGRVLGFGQVYLETATDAAGNWLDGGKCYRMHVEADAPVRQFWSITLYDNVTRGPLVTPQGAADMSSRRPDLVTNTDGSVDVFFGPARPTGATNWVQTLPGKGWFPYFRFYAATEAYFDKSWQLNDIEEIAA